MKAELALQHEFVEYIPDELKNCVIYVSITYKTVVHKCCCGCGNEVVTPLSPTGWQLTFDGETISMSPSIGNWSFACQSHYWIKRNRVTWAAKWSRKQIDAVRAHDSQLKEQYFESNVVSVVPTTSDIAAEASEPESKKGFWKLMMSWFFRT